ncbi:glutathione gamma-glutamylcysteinyltransferase 1 isoform X4 [Cajanus cajan]|uniref:glutathione gamma-glutamylcysteinyltransferase 1 isoform X4 n=1 Tax=Cajanus cajan TaxID=3821 RepID=UPI00098DA4A6|nr:glutathione gamma-glutamylcysteinyltransferase 1 isoform X4 [Cajanus cajan]
MAKAGFYRRLLPSPPAVEFASSKGKQLFLEAIQNGTMQGFFKLISYYQTQSELAFCGLTTLSMVLNALAIDPGRKWKGLLSIFILQYVGPWRWFDESMLGCWEPLETAKVKGISFRKLVCLAHCAGAKVEAFRASSSTIEEFRKYVIECSRSEDCHVIASYHRAAIKQTGGGHFSPIGGYHPEKDMVLILDVARFKYPPHWVPLEVLWEGMNYVVDTTRLTRGFMLISRPHRELYTLEEVLKQLQGTELFKYVNSYLSNSYNRQTTASVNGNTLPASVCCQGPKILGGKPDSSVGYCCRETHMRSLKAEDDKPITTVSGTVVDGNSEHGVDVLISSSSGKLRYSCSNPNKNISMHPAGTDVLTVLLLSLPSTTWDGIIDEQLLAKIRDLVPIDNLPTLLQEEVLHLRRQLHLLKRCQEGKVDKDLGARFS